MTPSRLSAVWAVAVLSLLGTAPAAPGATPPERTATARLSTADRAEVSYLPKRQGVLDAKSPAGTARSPVTPLSRGGPLAPTLGDEWLGIGPQPFTPADTVGAAGTTLVATAVNTRIAVWEKDGDPVLAATQLLSVGPSFPGGTDVFDPKVVWDTYRNRFVLVFMAAKDSEQASWIAVASFTEAQADQPSAWCVRKIEGDQSSGDGNQLADYPGLGFDKNRVYVTSNQFSFEGPGGFRHAQIVALPKGRLYDCDRKLRKKVFDEDQTRNPDGAKAFTIQPAVTQPDPLDPNALTPEYLLSFDGALTGRDLTLWRIKKIGDRLKLGKTSLAINPVDIAPYGTQKGGSVGNSTSWWDNGDLRLVNAFYDVALNALYGAHTVEGADPDDSAARWYEVEPATPLVDSGLLRTADVGQTTYDAGWPVMATDDAGNVWMAFSEASAEAAVQEYLSAYAAMLPPASTTEQLLKLEEGTDRYSVIPGPERWGDYNGISRDPADGGSIWMVNEIPVDDGGAPNTADEQQIVDRVSDV